MSDLFTLCYLDQTKKRFLTFLVTMLKQILTSDHSLNPNEIQRAQNILDILEGWMPLSVGSGSIALEIFRFGRLLIRLQDSRVRIHYKPWRRSAPSMSYRYILSVSRDFKGFITDDHVVLDDLNKLLNQAATLHGADFENQGVVVIKWRAGMHPIPVPEKRWVELRERALQKGEKPPRACHWLPDTYQEKENHHA